MAKRVFHHAVAVAPERVGDGHPHGATGFDGAVEGGVGVREIEVQEDARAAPAFGRKGVRRHFAAEHEDGIADGQLGVHHVFAIGRHEPRIFPRAESFFVELNGRRTVGHDDVRGERVESIGNGFGHDSTFI